MSTAAAIRDTAKGLVEEISTDLKGALPSNIPYERFRTTFITAVAHNPEILECDLNSVKTALMKSAIDNLLPDNREAAIVPFNTKVKVNGKEEWVKLAQYMPMVLGIRKRALELGGARIDAEPVHENDFYDEEQGDNPFIKHKPAPFNKPRGDIIGAYAIFKDEKTGAILHRERMSKEQIEQARSVSRAANGPGWTKFYSEMARKTVVRRGAKSIPSIPDQLRTIIERDDDYVDFEATDTRQRSIEHNPLVDEQRRLPASNSVPMDRIDQQTEKQTVEIDQRYQTESTQTNSSSPSTTAPDAQGDDRRGDAQPKTRLPAEIFRKYASSICRMQSADNIRKAHAQFWQDYQKPQEGTADHQLAAKILNLNSQRVEGKIPAEGLMDEIEGIIHESFGGL